MHNKKNRIENDYYDFLDDNESVSVLDLDDNLDEIEFYNRHTPKNYHLDENKVMDYWNEQEGKLSEFALGLLTCPSSSVSVESLFSSCSFMMNKQRNSILPEKLSDCQIIRSNSDLI